MIRNVLVAAVLAAAVAGCVSEEEYTVRSPGTETDHVALFNAIQASEVIERLRFEPETADRVVAQQHAL